VKKDLQKTIEGQIPKNIIKDKFPTDKPKDVHGLILSYDKKL